MKRSAFISILLASLLLGACGLPIRFTDLRGSGQLATETRQVSDINSVELSGMGTLIIEQGETETLEITAEDNLIEYLRSDVSGANLSLGIEDFINLQPTEDIVYHLTVKDLSIIETSGLGNVEMSTLKTDRIRLEISGSGSVEIADLQVESLDVDISGLGSIELSGSADDQDVEISGASNYQAQDLLSRTADVEISGTGSAVLWVTELLDVELSGVGSLEYYGTPVTNSEISGMGEIKSLGDK